MRILAWAALARRKITVRNYFTLSALVNFSEETLKWGGDASWNACTWRKYMGHGRVQENNLKYSMAPTFK